MGEVIENRVKLPSHETRSVQMDIINYGVDTSGLTVVP